MTLSQPDRLLYDRCAELLHRTIGLDVATVGVRSIDRAVDTVVAAWVGQDPDRQPYAFLDALQASDELQRTLIEAVVVPETWFFRDPDAFSALVQLALRRGRETGGAAPLRLLSLPCSTGEEPYTIAMALLGAGLEPANFAIDAMDISEHALAKAKHATYGRNSFRGTALAFRDAYFTPVEDGWRLSSRITDTVSFRRANLLRLDPSLHNNYDFVFCRNVLIYFDRDTQMQALAGLERTLMTGGTLFVGHAEGGLLTRYGMRAVKIPRAFAFQRETATTGADTAPRVVGAWTASTTPAPFAMPAVSSRAGAFAANGTLAHSGQSVSPAVAAREAGRAPQSPLPSHNSGGFAFRQPFAHAPQADAHARSTTAQTDGDPLAASRALADAGLFDEATAAISDYLARHPANAQAYYLLGVIADARGNTANARDHYKKALYLDPKHREALLHLGTLLELAGDNAGATRLMQRAGRVEDLS